jgi:hypothetical protein
MTSKAKMSTLMSRGAAKLPTSKEHHFTHDADGNITGACAIACMIYELGFYEQFNRYVDSLWYLPRNLYGILDLQLRSRDLPEDVRGLFRPNMTYVFYYIISEVNDKVSRKRAIKLVREMGY